MIKKGYRIEFTSWENDGDSYKTNVVQGLESEEEVRFYIKIANLFKSMNNPENKGFGNTFERDFDEKDLMSKLKNIYEKYGLNIDEGLKECFELMIEENQINYVTDWIKDEILGYPENYDLCFRVLDSFCVYYVPNEIEDITERFSS